MGFWFVNLRHSCLGGGDDVMMGGSGGFDDTAGRERKGGRVCVIVPRPSPSPFSSMSWAGARERKRNSQTVGEGKNGAMEGTVIILEPVGG
jgi:hypothetical protein